MVARDLPMRLFNSLGRKLEELRPIRPGEIRLYTCGLTVYDYAHLGNLRAYLFTDTLRRALQWKGYDVLHVMNITDVGHLTSDADEGEDKVERAAAKRQSSVWEITAYYTADFQANLRRLNILPPSVWCKATDHVQEMIAFAARIEAGGYAYPLDDGLYFDASKVADYGALGALDLEHQRAGARVEMKAGKRNPYDFCLWRASPPGPRRLMEWDSPWGRGAPGWHLECSAMSLKYLGAPFDIHTGGIDHRQVHHCNEIAQNQAYLRSDHAGVNLWLHNEFLLLHDEKMSKSAGDFLRLQTLVDRGIHPLVYRYFNLQTHYRSQLEFSMDALANCRTGLERLLRRVQAIRAEARDVAWLEGLAGAGFGRGAAFGWLLDGLTASLGETSRRWVGELDRALAADLNTPQAMALLSEVIAAKGIGADETLRVLAVFDLALGLALLAVPADAHNLRPADARVTAAEIEDLLAQRAAARKAKDFARADEVRKQLEASGVVVEDGAGGVRWSWAPSRSSS
jgi:cysteinyl-tRNA synthetase